MELFLLRHAEAVDTVKSGLDSDRHLTSDGEEKMYEYAKGLRNLDIIFDVIFSSPFKRAVETAEIVAEVFRCEKIIEKCEYLVPGGDYNHLFTLLRKKKANKSILLVGHEPSMSQLASILISKKPDSTFRFSKCSICCIEILEFPPKGVGELKWFLSPRVMKNLKK